MLFGVSQFYSQKQTKLLKYFLLQIKTSGLFYNLDASKMLIVRSHWNIGAGSVNTPEDQETLPAGAIKQQMESAFAI